MMQNLPILILSVSFTIVFSVIGYFLRSMHMEVKQFIKELTEYTNHLRQLIVGIQTHIDKGIETDIVELKEEIKRINKKLDNNLRSLNKFSRN